MMKKSKNSKISIPNIQENINAYAELTSSNFQKDVSLDTSINSTQYIKTNTDVIDYRIKILEENVKELTKEIQQPILNKIEKYKFIVGILVTIIGSLLTWAFHMYNNYLDSRFNSLSEKTTENSKKIDSNTSKISEINQKIYLYDYTINLTKENTHKK